MEKDWDYDVFFTSGWRQDTSKTSSSIGISKSSNAISHDERVINACTIAKDTKIVTPPICSDEFQHIFKKISWFLDRLQYDDINHHADLRIYDTKFLHLDHISQYEELIAYPVFKEDDDGDVITTDETIILNTDRIDPFIDDVLNMAKRPSVFLPYLIFIQGRITAYDISLKMKFDRDGKNKNRSHGDYELLTSPHMANKTSLVGKVYRRFKEICAETNDSKIKQQFFAVFNETQRCFIVGKVPH